MGRLKTFKQRWLPLALVPLFSVSVLAGCGSDDDDDDGSTDQVVTDTDDTDTGTDAVLVGDVDGDGVVDAFETSDTTLDANGNGLIDSFETAADGTDANENGIDDSFEVALTNGVDANADGVDDDSVADDTDAGDTDTGDTDTGGTTPEAVDQTGPLNDIPVGEVGIADFEWNGTNLSGQVAVESQFSPVSAVLHTGISASGLSEAVIPLNGGPTFFIPSVLEPSDEAIVQDNIVSGNMFVRVTLADGSTRDGIILLEGVEPEFNVLSSDNNVSGGDAFSNGVAFININTLTGDFTAAINVNLNASDVNANGEPETVSVVHIHRGAAGEEGPVIVPLEDAGNGTRFTATGVFDAADLELVLNGEAYFNVHRSDPTINFMRGQIPAQ